MTDNQTERLIEALNACTAMIREYIAIAKPIEPEKVVSIGDAARRLGVTRQTVSRMIQDGRLHKVMRGGVRGILLSELSRISDCRHRCCS